MSHRTWMFAAFFAMSMSGRALAQHSEPAIVTASGQATITAQPELVRVTIDLTGQGKDIKEALAKLTEENELAKAKLSVLGAASDAIQVGDPRIGDAAPSDARALAMAMMNPNGRAPAAASKLVKVTATLEAKVALKGTSAADKLVESAELMEKAKVAFARKLTAEEQEIMEEMQNQSRGEARPGEPQFAFIHVITAAERTKATADALSHAKESAARLAQAAGAKLGAIRQLSESASSTSSPASNDYPAYYARAMGLANTTSSAPPDEATSAQPGPVTFVVTVSVGYSLE